MKAPATILLLFFAASWAAFEILHPPMVYRFWNPWDWGGMWSTIHTRRGLGDADWANSNMNLHVSLLIMECLLTATAVTVGWITLFVRSRAGTPRCRFSASQALARCALVLHPSIVLFPLCSAGMDTIWVISNTFFAAAAVVPMIPNLLSAMFTWKISGWRSNATEYPAVRLWQIVFVFLIAMLWTLGFCLLQWAGWDANSPMSGVILGTVALWFTLVAIIQHRRLSRTAASDHRSQINDPA